MLSCCLKCRKNTKVVGTKDGRIMFLSKCTMCDSKNFIKEKEAIGLLSSLGVKAPSSKIPLVCPLLF